MDKKSFWFLIDRVNAEASSRGQDEILKLTEHRLMELPAEEIRDWHSIQHEYAAMADRNDLRAAYRAIGSYWSDDGFIDFRSWLISQGEKMYMTALCDPDSLADWEFSPNDIEFESYGYVAAYAFAQKIVMEQEGPEALKQQYAKWCSNNAEKITAQFENSPLSEEDQKRYIARWFRSHLSAYHDVYSAAEQKPLSAECLADIRLDQKKKADISSNWTLDDLPEIVPKLYAKFNSPDMLTIYTVHF